MIPLSNFFKKQKLAISFFAVILLFVSSGVVTINGLQTLGDLTKKIYKHPIVVSNASLQAALEITRINRDMKDAMLASTPDEIKSRLKAVDVHERKVYKQLDIVRKDILGKDGKILEKQARQFFVNWKPLREKAIRLLKSGKRHEAILITKTDGAEYVATLADKMLQLTTYAQQEADSFLEFTETKRSNLEKITIILTCSGILISLIIAFFTTRIVLNAEILLKDKNQKLQKALDEIKTLRGILPICSFCKNIRNDQGYYEQIEEYIHKYSGVDFSHTVCPSCLKKHYPEEYERMVLTQK